MRALLVLMIFVSNICALPKGCVTKLGRVSVSEAKDKLEIHQKDKQAILEWKEFCVNECERVHFIQPENGAVLNKVMSDKLSEIHGLLKADGNLYLMNDKGLIVGKNGKVEAKSFFVIGSSCQDDGFLNCETFKVNTNALIVNKGVIQTKNGNVTLIAKEVVNTGTIQAGQGDVCLVAGSEILLKKEKEEHVCVSLKGVGSVENGGLIKAAQVQIQAAGGDIYSLAINQKGVIEADGITKENGKIILSAKSHNVEISGEMHAKNQERGGSIEIKAKDEVNILEKALITASGNNEGGEIFIGTCFQNSPLSVLNTKRINIEPGAKVQANAIEKGNGGKVVIWSDEQNIFQGSVAAKGGCLQGDGGFVEISCPKHLVFLGNVDTSAQNGKTGVLLLDPSDIVIDDFGGSSTPTFPTDPPGTYNPAGAIGQLDVANLQTALASTNVTVSTAGGVGGAGSVTINRGFTWSASTTFSVIANRNLVIDNATISNTNILGGFTAFDLQAGQLGIIGGNFDGIFMRNSTISSVTGDINLLARGGSSNNNYGIHLFNSTVTSIGLALSPATITLDGTGGAGVDGLSGVVIESNSSINSSLGDISITGASNGTGSLNHGIWLFLSSEIVSDDPGINAAIITLDGTSSTGGGSNYGVNIEENSTVSSNSGNMDVTALSNGTGNQCIGLMLQRGSEISSVGVLSIAATLTVNATSGTGNDDNRGIHIEKSSSINSINGNLDFVAESRGIGTVGNPAILLSSNSFIQSIGVGIDSADITILGIPGGGELTATRSDNTSGVTIVDGVLNITGGFVGDDVP